MTSELRALLDQVPPEEIQEAVAALSARMPVEEIPIVVNVLTSKLAMECARRDGHVAVQAAAQQEGTVRLLTPKKAAELAQMPVRSLHRLTRGMRFRRAFTRKRIMFEETGFLRWLRPQR